MDIIISILPLFLLSFILGIILGTIIAVCGVIKQKIKLAIGGFFACVGASLLLGAILGIPIFCIFLHLILKKKKTDE